MITLLKLGGSVITDKSRPYTARDGEIARLAGEIKEALDEIPKLRLIVGNGGGSFPHQPAQKGKLADGIREAWQLEHLVETYRSAAELNHIVVTALVKRGVPAISVKASSAAYTDGGEIVDFNVLMINKLLEIKAVPVIYGDVLVDLKNGCSIASTEKLFSYLAGILQVRNIIIGTNVDGVLDDKGEVIPEITESSYKEVKKYIRGAENTDVTGGMLHKVESMLRLAEQGREVLITNALKPGNIRKALGGRTIGTRIVYG